MCNRQVRRILHHKPYKGARRATNHQAWLIAESAALGEVAATRLRAAAHPAVREVRQRGHKIPRYVANCSEFPMTVTGKIQKHKLRAQAIEKLGLHTAAGVRTA